MYRQLQEQRIYQIQADLELVIQTFYRGADAGMYLFICTAVHVEMIRMIHLMFPLPR